MCKLEYHRQKHIIFLKHRPTQHSQNGTQKLPEMRLFLGTSTLFVHPLWSRQDVLPWKMIACHHAKVQPTAGGPAKKAKLRK